MKMILFLACLFYAFDSNSQVINGTFLKDIQSEYIFVSGISKNTNGRIIVEVDYGQALKTSLLKDNEQPRMKDDKGKNVEFNSMIEVINYFTKNGWDYVQGFAPDTSGPWNGSQYTLNCLFRKRK
jgi:hypothetical protein